MLPCGISLQFCVALVSPPLQEGRVSVLSSARSLHAAAAAGAGQAAAEPSSDAGADKGSERLSENDVVSPNFVNRNPRNLERMAVARKDKGWGQSHPRRDFWHK